MNSNEHSITKYKPISDTSLRSYLRPLFEKKWIVLLTFLATLGTTFMGLRNSQQTYQSQVLMMQTESSGNPNVLFNPAPVFSDSYSKLLGRSLIEGHLEILNGTSAIERIQEQLSHKYQLEFTVAQIRGDFSLSNQRGSPIIRLTATADTPERVQALANTVAEAYLQQLNELKKRDLTQGIVFLEQQMITINNRLIQVEAALNKFKTTNKSSFSSNGVPSGLSASNRNSTKLQELEAELSKTEMEIEWAEVKLRSIQNIISEASSTSESASHPLIDTLQSKLIDTQMKLDSMRGTYTDSASEVIEVKRQIKAYQERLDSELAKDQNKGYTGTYSLAELRNLRQEAFTLEVDLQGSREKEALLKAKIATFTKEHPNLVTEQMELSSLQRQARVHEQTYLMILEKYEEMSLVKEMEMSRLQIVNRAEAASPVGTSAMILLPLSGILGLGLGVSIAFLLAYLDDSIKWKEDVEKHLALPTIGVIPKIKPVKLPKSISIVLEGKRKHRRQIKRLLSRTLLFDNSSTADSESARGKTAVNPNYQTLAAQIRYANVGTSVKTLLVTSTVPHEGKTTTLVNLAVSLARAGKKVLLIDTDLQSGQIHCIFQQESFPGLTDFLIDENKFSDTPSLAEPLIRPTAVNNLYIFPTGTYVSNPEMFLSAKELDGLLQSLEQEYDMILFDSPALLSTADAMMVAPRVDGTLLVLKSGTTKRHVAREAIELLENINAKILGVILNHSKSSKQY
jgi:polysaccharide biosynthesis transport protein